MSAWCAMPGDRTMAAVGGPGRLGGRRDWLKRSGTIGLLLGFGVAPMHAVAASQPVLPFDATLMPDVLKSLGGPVVASTAIDLEVPELTENGAMVPIAVTSRLPRTTQIILVADANPFPLVASFDIPVGTEPYVSTRVKLAQTCTVSAIVRADGKLYAVARQTAVTVGGCGG